MPSPKYPLQPLLDHRARKVDDATAQLGAAVRARESADEARARAEAAQREAEERAATERAAEIERLERGELRVLDLARGDAWEVGVRSQIDRLAHAVDAADENARAARQRETQARAELAQEMADRDVVVKDEARFRERVAKRALAAEEEAAEEAYRGRRTT